MKQNPSVLQHYVPRFLLQRFTGTAGRLWVYDTEKKRIFQAAPNRVAAENGFYGEGTGKPTEASIWIEKFLDERIECPGSRAIEAIINRQGISPEQFQSFYLFVAAQLLRTPAALNRTHDFIKPLMQEMARRIARYSRWFRKQCIDLAKAEGFSDEGIWELNRMLDSGDLTVTPRREYVVSVSLANIRFLAKELSRMRWTFLQPHPYDDSLIIGDHPVLLFNEIRNGGFGLREPGIQIVMPLNTQMVCIGRWSGPISYGELYPGMVDVINEQTMRNAGRFVFASFKSDELLSQAVSLRGKGPKIYTTKVNLGQKLLMTSVYR